MRLDGRAYRGGGREEAGGLTNEIRGRISVRQIQRYRRHHVTTIVVSASEVGRLLPMDERIDVMARALDRGVGVRSEFG